MTYFKPIRGCSRCYTLARRLRYETEELANAKLKLQRRYGDAERRRAAMAKACITATLGEIDEHLVDHPAPASRELPPVEDMDVAEAEITHVRTQRFTLRNGEIRDFPDTAIEGRKYRVKAAEVTSEHNGRAWGSPVARLSGVVITRTGEDGKYPAKETLGDPEAFPGWLKDLLTDPEGV